MGKATLWLLPTLGPQDTDVAKTTMTTFAMSFIFVVIVTIIRHSDHQKGNMKASGPSYLFESFFAD